MVDWKQKLNTMTREKQDYALNHLVQTTLSSPKPERIEELLGNIHFLEAKTEAGKVFELVDDFACSHEQIDYICYNPHLYRLVEQALRRDIHFIARHPESLFQCLWNSCWWYDCPEAKHYYAPYPNTDDGSLPWNRSRSQLYHLLEAWRKAKRENGCIKPWLKSLSPPASPLESDLQVSFAGHSESACELVFSSDGKTLLSASYDHTIRLWDCRNLKEIAASKSPKGSFLSLGFLDTKQPAFVIRQPNGDFLLTEFKTGRTISQLRASKDIAECFTMSKDCRYMSCGYRNGMISIWELSSGREVTSFDIKQYVKVSEVSVKSELLRLSGLIDSLFKTTNRVESKEHDLGDYIPGIQKIQELHANVANLDDVVSHKSEDIQKPDIYPIALSFLSEEKILIWTSNQGTVHLYDLEQNRETIQHSVPGATASIQISRDGTKLFCGGFAGIFALDVRTGDILWGPDQGIKSSVVCMEMSNDEKILVAGYREGCVSLFNTEDGAVMAIYKHEHDCSDSIAISPNGNKIAFASSDAKINIINVADIGKNSLRKIGHTDSIICMTMSLDGSYYVTGDSKGFLRLWESKTTKELITIPAHNDLILNVVFINNEQAVLSWSFDQTIKVWDLKNRKELVPAMAHPATIESWDINERLDLVISGCNNGMIYIWNLKTGKLLHSFEAHEGAVRHLSLSFDGMYLASGGDDFKVNVWEMPGGNLEFQAGISEEDEDGFCYEAPRPVYFHNSPRQACNLGDDAIRFYNINTGKQEACLEPGKAIQYFALTDDDKHLIAQCADGEILVWMTEDYQLVDCFKGYLRFEGDFWAITTRFPWKIVPHDTEISIKHAEQEGQIVWIDRKELSVLPETKIFVGFEGAFLYSYSLEEEY